MDEREFQILLQQVRNGDQIATNMLVNRYEDHIRRIIRVMLAHSEVRKDCESADIFQSVVLNLFVKIRVGLYDLANDTDLMRVVNTMVRNKIIDKHRKIARKKSYIENSYEPLETLPAKNESTPSSLVAHQDLVESVIQRLTGPEQVILKHRQKGQSWNEIGELLGMTSDAACKRLQRGVQRVLGELGLEDDDYDE